MNDYFPLDFHLSSKARWEHGVDEALAEAAKGDSPQVQAARLIAARLGKLAAADEGKKPVYASEILAMGLLAEIFRFVFDRYCTIDQPNALKRALQAVEEECGKDWVEQPLKAFLEYFPPEDVVRKKVAPEDYWQKAGRETSARELALLYLLLENGALNSYRPLFDDTELQHAGPSLPFTLKLNEYFHNQPPMEILGETLFEILRAPVQASPYNLEGQLQYIQENWSDILPEHLRRRLLTAAGMVREETKPRGHVVSESAAALTFQSLGLAPYPEPERYSEDADWMSSCVLIAKNAYVWLDQLSKKHQKTIKSLDQIPDGELERLARWGFTGLWLIGLWKRSPASQKIKRIMGNPDAESSAYSLFDYVISDNLGGEEALHNLAERARRYGIKMASDMVPNHVGIYSRWVIEHPDWFIQLDHPPFPENTFNGPDLSDDPRVSIYIEDGYWNHSDAAVVFKRVDKATGSTRYIYHGNDGTHMPWNDTAQLNYLNPEVREGAIQTILHVARHFPIIRFDAAMTLMKQHYQRLWFPGPGEGGAIPSRQEHGMTKEEFDEQMPREFWVDVVDRVAAEAPNTLLLAEAFWMTEGYFVRTLGMHRVYNSAFMNMLKVEDNANYRTTVKNVLEFSPEIIKRFVNFMNNPDERTAVDQFGKGDKYIGIAVMLATMPGLPMFGHGQIEGFAEKYGMEYRRAYWDEAVDEELVQRHEEQIFPLLRKRRLFSGAENFALFDFFTPDGWVDENVFAYSNRSGNEKALVLYNNSYDSTSGWIRTSTRINVGEKDKTDFMQKSLAEVLRIQADPGHYYIFRDHRDGREYLRKGGEIAENGLFFELKGYQYYVLLNWREVFDADGSWAELDRQLRGRGVSDMAKARGEMVLQPLLSAFRRVFETALNQPLPELKEPISDLLKEMRRHDLPKLELEDLWEKLAADLKKTETEPLLILFSLICSLTPIFIDADYHTGPRSQWLDDWLLTPILEEMVGEKTLLLKSMLEDLK